MADNTLVTLQPVWQTRLSVDTAPNSDTPSYAELCAGIESIEEALNEQVKQYFFLGGNGFAHHEVGSMAPTFTLSGRRVHGDAAQDYIEGQKYIPADGRRTRIQLVSNYTVGKTTHITTITCNATMTAIHTIGGASNDNSPFSVTFSLNGKPDVKTA